MPIWLVTLLPSIIKLVFMGLDFIGKYLGLDKEIKELKKAIEVKMVKAQGKEVEKVVDVGNEMEEQEKYLRDKAEKDRSEL